MFPWQINSTHCICGFLSIAIIKLAYLSRNPNVM